MTDIDWSKAPEWANWIGFDYDGKRLWFENEPNQHPRCNITVWVRSSGKWMEDFRQENDVEKAGLLFKRPDDGTFDYLEAMRLYADGVELERLSMFADGWVDVDDDDPVVRFSKFSKYRRKPKTMTLAGIEFPEPIREEPDRGTDCFCVFIGRPAAMNYNPSSLGHVKALKRGLLQATREGAEQERRALILSVGGDPD